MIPKEESIKNLPLSTEDERDCAATGREYGTVSEIIRKYPDCIIKDPEAYLQSHEYMTLEEFMERMSKYC